MAKRHHRIQRGIDPRRKKKRSFSWVFALLAVVCLCLALFQETSLQDPAQTLHVVLRDYAGLIESLHVSAVAALQDLGIDKDWISVVRPRRNSLDAMTRIKARVPANIPLPLCNLEVTKAVQYLGGQVIQGEEDGQGTGLTLSIGMNESVTSAIILSKDYSLSRVEGQVAIIIEGLGQALDEVCQGFLNFAQPLTLAVLPHRKASQEVADAAFARGLEVVLDLPMESHDSGVDLGRKAILSSLSSTEVRKRVQEALQSLPHIKGAANYMGSKITENEVIMNTVLSEVKAQNLYWIDGMTSPHSVAHDQARLLGIRAGRSSLRLDSERNQESVEAYLKRLAGQGPGEISFIAIGPGNRATLQMLQEQIPRLEKRGIRFVHASELIQ